MKVPSTVVVKDATLAGLAAAFSEKRVDSMDQPWMFSAWIVN